MSKAKYLNNVGLGLIPVEPGERRSLGKSSDPVVILLVEKPVTVLDKDFGLQLASDEVQQYDSHSKFQSKSVSQSFR